MKPSVGRIVHYTNLGDRDGRYPPEVQAALITKVKYAPPPEVTDESPDAEVNYQVSLRIFYEMGDFAMVGVPFTQDAAGVDAARGHWAWPARA